MYGQVWLTRKRLLRRKTNISMCESYFTFCKWNWITKFPFFYVPYITYRLLGYAQEWCNNDQNERFQDCRLDKVAILTGQKNHGSSCEMAYWLAAAVATFYTALGYWSETPGRIYPTLALDRKCIYLPVEGPSQTLREMLPDQQNCIWNHSCPTKSQITRFMEPTWGPPESCRSQMDPMLVPFNLLSGMSSFV